MRDHRRHHVAALRLHGGVDQHLEEHVALRVAAAEQADLRLARRQQIDHARVLAAAVRLRRLAHRNDHIGDRRRGPQRGVGGEFPQRGDEPCRRRVAPGGDQRQHQMRHHQQMPNLADAGLGLVGQFVPAVADVEAQLFQPPQQRGGVLQIDVVVGRRLGHRVVEVADVLVVARHHRVHFAEVEAQQGAVPPQVMDQVVAQRPVDHLCAKPVAALARAAVGVHDVRLHMVREVVGRVALQRRIHRRLGAFGVADLLMGERPDGLRTIVAGQIGGPARRDAVGLLEDRLRLAMAEPDGVADAERQQIGRVRVQDLPPDAKELSSDPRCQASAAARCIRSRAVMLAAPAWALASVASICARLADWPPSAADRP